MINPRPPSGFITLEEAAGLRGKSYDTIGVCTDYLPPAKSAGSDFTTKFVLHDPSWFQDRGMTFRFFNSTSDKLPKISGSGDVIILRNVMTTVFNHQSIGISNSTTSWVVLSGSSILESLCPRGTDIIFVASSKGLQRAPTPTEEELLYAKEIVRLEDPMAYKPPPKATALDVKTIIQSAGGTAPARREKWQPISELSSQPKVGKHNFADLFGEVRRSWYNDNGRMELSLTDYTSNKLLYSYAEEAQSRDGDTFAYTGALHDKWPGPWGRMTIGVTLYDVHAEFAKLHVKPGMYVLIKNCQIKLDHNGSRLEAVCRGDRDDMSKVNVSIYAPHQAESDQRFKGLLKRRLEYEKMAKSKGLRFGFGDASKQDSRKIPLERIANDAEDVRTNADQSKKSSKSKKSKRKRARGEKDRSGAQIHDLTENQKNSVQTNQYVRCENIDVPLKPIDDILDPSILKRKTPSGNTFSLPFQNCSYKCKVRVVDYFPSDIADFSVPYLVTEYDALSDADDPTQGDTTLALTAAQNNPHTVRWEWRFFLVVEDAGLGPTDPQNPRKQMPILVADQDGDYLLRDEATDLRANPQELAKLREKLFVLWGDLQEKKEEEIAAGVTGATMIKAQSKPFECFIKEYGVPLPRDEEGKGELAVDELQYQRMFRMFGTSI